MSKYIIGVDLGGTKIAVALATQQGKIIKDIFLPTPKTSANDIYKAIKKAIKKVQYPYNKSKISCIGFGIPGIYDLKKGKVINAPNLKLWNGFELLKKLKKDYKIPIKLDNDANAAALAENLFGAGKKYHNFVYLTVSTGIGGGIIIHKQIYYGSHNTAGEIGHTIIETAKGMALKNSGTVENLASGTALSKIAAKKCKVSSYIYKLCHGKRNNIDAQLVFEAAKKGDKLAKSLIRENGEFLAATMVNIANILDPEVIIIGGGMANNGHPFFDSIKKGLKHFELMTTDKKIKILPAKLKKHSGLYGAIALAMSGSK
ncbi:ROK family protein [Candidatus Margulisiibacteriota bacterium]